MSVVNELLKDVKIPRMVDLRQIFPRPKIEVEDIPAAVREQLMQPKVKATIKPGMRIAITAGSRGVRNIALIIKSIAEVVKELGAYPFVVPAMGSHGGATAEGQREVIASFGVVEEYVGCPIISSMETKLLGKTDEGHDVRIDKNAAEADGIIVLGRVKPHTCFRGPYESGLMKMMTIGLGKQAGAEIAHEAGFKYMAHMVPLFGKAIIRLAPVIMGFALLENPFDETAEMYAMPADEIEEREPALLVRAKELMPKILIPECDVLVVDEIGKDISGDGMDPNITGTFCTPYATGGVKWQKVCVLDLTEESHHNGNGMGMASAICKRLFDKVDLEATYPNCITSTVLDTVRIPLIRPNDKETIQVCIRTCNEIDKANPRIIRIKNSLHIEHISVSEALLEEAKAHPQLEVLGEPYELDFNEQGNLF